MENSILKKIEEIKKYDTFLKPEILYYFNSRSPDVQGYIDDLPDCELKFLPFYKKIIDEKLIRIYNIDTDKDFWKSLVFQVEKGDDYFKLVRLQLQSIETIDITEIITITSPYKELLSIIK